MATKKKIIIKKKQRKTLHDHLERQICKYYHKNFHIAHHSHHNITHIGELILVLLVGCMSWMFAWWVWLPSNNAFIYPIQQVSTIDCRTQQREQMEAGCKINLPRITNANYTQFKESSVHRQMYTVLWAAPYKAGRDQNIWAHAGLDIATARWTPLHSIGDWQITYAWRQNGYGNVVKIKYLFKWHYIHAVYAHMDTIQVEAGQSISAGQKIWTVGNSGTTFWALGWFHVHFEITKDNHGRPMYGYNGCPDIKKWHMTIIQEGLCREQLLNNQYDPIVLFEQNRLWHVIDTTKNEESATPEEIVIPKEIISEPIVTQPLPQDILPEKPSVQIQPEVEIKNPNKTAQPITPAQPIIQEPILEEQEQVIHSAPEKEVEPTYIPTPIDDKRDRIWEKIIIETQDLSEETKHFFNNYDMYINNHTWSNNINVGWNKEIEINFYKKNSNTKFVGILPFILDLIPSQTSIISDINTLQLISPNPSIIKIQWKTAWRSSLIMSIDNNTIYKILYTIQ